MTEVFDQLDIGAREVSGCLAHQGISVRGFVIAKGGFRRLELVEKTLLHNEIDYVPLSRSLGAICHYVHDGKKGGADRPVTSPIVVVLGKD